MVIPFIWLTMEEKEFWRERNVANVKIEVEDREYDSLKECR